MLVMYQCQREALQLPNSSNQKRNKLMMSLENSDMIVLDIFVWSIYMLLFSNNFHFQMRNEV